nr:alpha/beta hydrolase-fold protein [Verrucomicrobiota bacterium]
MPESTLTGNIQRHPKFPSKILGNNRDVLVYLPLGYRRSRTRCYPVLYLHDGQNVFDAATAFGQVEWGADETAQRLIEQKLIEPVIIVAVANTEDRIHEYAPTRGRIQDGKRRRSKGLLRRYGKFLIEELKPFIDARYRTLVEPDYTGLGGSSLGGLATIALGL